MPKTYPSAQWSEPPGSKAAVGVQALRPALDEASGVWGFEAGTSGAALTESGTTGVHGVDTAPASTGLRIVERADGHTLIY
jgi:hypothetical protein